MSLIRRNTKDEAGHTRQTTHQRQAVYAYQVPQRTSEPDGQLQWHVSRIHYTNNVPQNRISRPDTAIQKRPYTVDRNPTYETMETDLKRRLNNDKNGIKEKKEEIRRSANLQELPLF